MNPLNDVTMRPLMCLALAAALTAPRLARADIGLDGGLASAKPGVVQYSLIGFWQRTTKDKDKATPFLCFKKTCKVESGTITAVGAAEIVGAFAYRIEDGELSITGNDGDLVATIEWLDANHFSLATEGKKPTIWARCDDPRTVKPAPKKQKPAADDAVELMDTGWLRVDASDDGSHKTVYFGPGGVLVVADVTDEGQILNKKMGRYTQNGNKVVLRDSDGAPLVTWTMTRDDKGYLHMTRSDGAETVWMPLTK